jgi:fumarate reductase flavoprotein subunit
MSHTALYINMLCLVLVDRMDLFDLIVLGAGTAGLPTAIFAAQRGMRVLLAEKQERIGGTLHVAQGQLAAAGTSLQQARGIQDSPALHFADVMRISRGTADPGMVRLAVEAAADTIEWLRAADFDFHPDCPGHVAGHEAYQRPRSHWGTNRAVSILTVLDRALAPHLLSGAVQVHLSTHLVSLLLDGPNRVAGARLRGPDGVIREFRSRQVAITTGGYCGNPDLFSKLDGLPLYGPLPTGASGEGVAAALAAGAAFRNRNHFLPGYGGIETEPGSRRVATIDRPSLDPRTRPPWEIHVNRRGQRFVAEDTNMADVRERALCAQPDLVFWIVYDSRIARMAPPLLPNHDPVRMRRCLLEHPSYHQAQSIDELARIAGIDPLGLRETVMGYNATVARGYGDHLGRSHLPLPLCEPPFFALRNHGIAVKSPGGIDVRTDLRVRRCDGTVFDNLFAAGETIGGSLLSGHAFVGGMSLTPWLSFGRLIGQRFAS